MSIIKKIYFSIFNFISKFTHVFFNQEEYFKKKGYKKPFNKSINFGGKFIGRYTYGYLPLLNSEISFSHIGHFCSIAPNVTITNMNHPISFVTTNPILYYPNRGFVNFLNKDLIKKKNAPVVIKNDVWIGQNVTILPSVIIENGSIIAAGSVVTKDVPPYAIVAGVPAKVIKFRFSEDKIKQLLAIAWWEWTDEKIRENIEYFYNVDNFIKKHI